MMRVCLTDLFLPWRALELVRRPLAQSSLRGDRAPGGVAIAHEQDRPCRPALDRFGHATGDQACGPFSTMRRHGNELDVLGLGRADDLLDGIAEADSEPCP